ncbi:hypothetical protein DENSPDRAFT_491387 [Dentipellis sp. KUC8613]|nr:hypothetical protein DENSPDRAFT_491387 [Dentipellis sp. KUC8613]
MWVRDLRRGEDLNQNKKLSPSPSACASGGFLHAGRIMHNSLTLGSVRADSNLPCDYSRSKYATLTPVVDVIRDDTTQEVRRSRREPHRTADSDPGIATVMACVGDSTRCSICLPHTEMHAPQSLDHSDLKPPHNPERILPFGMRRQAGQV